MEQLNFNFNNKQPTSLHSINIIRFYSIEFDCAYCDKSTTDSFAWPWYNGEPVANSKVSDGGHCSVCKECYEFLLGKFPD